MKMITLATGRRVPFRTVGDVRDEKRLSDDTRFGPGTPAPRDLSTEAQAAAAATDSRIDVLMRNGSPVFYATIDGKSFEGTLSNVYGTLVHHDAEKEFKNNA